MLWWAEFTTLTFIILIFQNIQYNPVSEQSDMHLWYCIDRYVWHRLYLLKDIFLTRVYISWHMNSLRDSHCLSITFYSQWQPLGLHATVFSLMMSSLIDFSVCIICQVVWVVLLVMNHVRNPFSPFSVLPDMSKIMIEKPRLSCFYFERPTVCSLSPGQQPQTRWTNFALLFYLNSTIFFGNRVLYCLG